MYVNKCIKCGAEFETKNPKRVICPNCLYADKGTESTEEKPMQSYSSYSSYSTESRPRSYDRPQQGGYRNINYSRNRMADIREGIITIEIIVHNRVVIKETITVRADINSADLIITEAVTEIITQVQDLSRDKDVQCRTDVRKNQLDHCLSAKNN